MEMDETRHIERLPALRAEEGTQLPAVYLPSARGRAAARAGGPPPDTPDIRYGLDLRPEWHDLDAVRLLEEASHLPSLRSTSPGLVAKMFATGPLPGVPVSWLVAGDLLAVGSLVAGCALTAAVLGPVGLLATVAFEAMAYAGGVLITQSGQEDLEKAQRSALLQSAQDPRTGALDPAMLMDVLKREFHGARSSGAALALLLIQPDDLEEDAAEPDVLRHVAERAASALRAEDAVGMHGQGQLMVVAPGFGFAPATMLAERIRLAVASAPLRGPGGEVSVTVSIGAAATECAAMAELPALVKRVGQALYRARRRGRNRVVVVR